MHAPGTVGLCCPLLSVGVCVEDRGKRKHGVSTYVRRSRNRNRCVTNSLAVCGAELIDVLSMQNGK